MKKLFIPIIIFGGLFLSWPALSQQPTDYALDNFQTTVTNIVANSTNSVISAVPLRLPKNGTAARLRITVSAISTAASTSNLVMKFSISMDGTNFTDGATSNIKVAVPMTGSLGATNTQSDWFYLPAVKAIAPSVIENASAGNSSNINAIATYNY